MVKHDGQEHVLEFTTFLKGETDRTKKIGTAPFPSYQAALFTYDLIAAILAFGFGTWIAGLGFFVMGNPIQYPDLIILGLLIIPFFPTYNLYSYHLLFSNRNHLINLIKSSCWSLLTLGIVVFLYAYPQVLEEPYLIPLIIPTAAGMLVLSKYRWNHLSCLLRSLGLSFLAIGILELISPEKKPVIIEHWHSIPIVFFMAVCFVMVGRSFLVEVVFNQWMRRSFRRQVAIVGWDEEAKRITTHIVEHNAPFWVAGFVGAKEAKRLELSTAKHVLGELGNLPRIVQQQDITEIIVTNERIDKETLVSLLDYCSLEGLTVWLPPRLIPIIDLKLNVDTFCGLPMIRLCSQKNSYIFDKIKHGFDALIALPLFVLLLPLFLVISIAIKLNSRGPVFYRASAVGKSGREFTMYKFRSMYADTGNAIHKNYVTKFITGQIREGSGKSGAFKVTDDPRITPVGAFLRKYSLDELPQLLNILKGEMSFVGPRPCLPYEYELFTEWHKKRHSIRPGITCLWQVAGRSAVPFEDMVLLDLYYVYNRNLLMDMSIIYETIFAVLKKKGAY